MSVGDPAGGTVGHLPYGPREGEGVAALPSLVRPCESRWEGNPWRHIASLVIESVAPALLGPVYRRTVLASW